MRTIFIFSLIILRVGGSLFYSSFLKFPLAGESKDLSVQCEGAMKIFPSEDLSGYRYHFTEGDAKATSCGEGTVGEEAITPEDKCIDLASKGTTKVAYIYFYQEIQSKDLSFKIMCKDGYGEVMTTEDVR